MAQISLKNYLAKLERLLDEASADEVIQHSRHLLKYFPKNAAAFRSLGLGLLLNGRWQEAESALRRVLTALPDDYRAHLGLSEAYTSMALGDQAISHLERAFEQNPNSRELIDGLRGLYRRFRQTDRVKIQLTTGAIARQYRRNQSPQQAITVLRSALERTPGRLDLSLLLADTLWDTGAHVEAAEIAVDILKRLPDCIIANQIMTRLWLEARRPTDAARYLSRIEAVDPILAYEIVQGSVPDTAFMIDEIDYRRVAQTELVSRRPDWLQTIGVTAPAESAADGGAEDEQPAWLADAISALPDAQARRPAPPLAEADDDDWMATVRTPSLTNQLNLPPEFSSSARDVNTDELEALFGQDDEEELPASWELDAPAASAVEEQPTLDDFTFDFGSPEAKAEPEPAPAVRDSRPAWMMDDSDEMDEPDLGVMGSEGVIHEDIPDWMHDAMFAAEADDSGNMDWLKDDLFDSRTGAELKSELSQDDSFDWLTAADSEVDDAESSTLQDENKSDADEGVDDFPFGVTDAQPDALTRVGLAQTLNEAGYDWLNEPHSDAPAEPPAEWLTDPADMQGEDDLSAAPLSDTESRNGGWNMSDNPQPPESSDDSLDWLTNAEDDAAASSEYDMPELDSLAPGEDDLPTWMSQAAEGESDEDSSLSDADIPDWLLQSADSPSEDTDAESAPEGESGWLSEFAPTPEDTEEDLSWLSEVDSEAKPNDLYDPPKAAASSSASEPPDEFSWLSEEEPEPVDPNQMPDWLVALEEAGEQGREETKLSYQPDIQAEAEPLSDTPDWLAELQPDAATAADVSDFDLDAEPEAESELVSDTPDWLAELQPDAAIDAVSDFDLDAEPEAEAEPLSDTPDWLAELQPDAVTAADVSDFDLDAEPEAETELVSDTPDWLAELQPDAAIDAVSDFDLDAEPEAEAELVSDTPDWLAELQPESEFSVEEEAEAALAAASESSENAFGWSDNRASAEDEPALEETPEWLRTLSEESADEALEEPLTEAELEMAESELIAEADPVSMLESEFEDEIAAPVAAENAPDWLNAMVPGLDVDYEAREEEIADDSAAVGSSRRDYEWVVALVENEAAQIETEMAYPRFVFTRQPVWLAPPAPQTEEQDDGLPEWPTDQEKDGDQNDDMPEWLR